MARRDGQIIARGERRWLVRWHQGCGADGQRIYRAKTIHGTKRDAQAELNKVLRSRDTGEYVEPNKLTLSDYVEHWLRDAAAPKVSPRTLEGYRIMLEKHVLPVLGSQRLAQVTTLDVQNLINGMSKRGLSPRSLQMTHRILNQALKQAVRWRLLAVNPAQGVELPKQQPREKRAFSIDEIRRFREAAKGTTHAVLWDFLLATGCRPGEALALRWADLENGAVTIRRTLTKDEDGKLVFAAPKTKLSTRTIPLPEAILRALAGHRKAQAEQTMKLGPAYARDLELVFANEVGLPLDEANLRSRHYKTLCKAAEIEGARGPYDLRHTVATQLLALGTNVKVVSERLGHASAAMTLDVYAHVVPGMQEEATERLGAALFAD